MRVSFPLTPSLFFHTQHFQSVSLYRISLSLSFLSLFSVSIHVTLCLSLSYPFSFSIYNNFSLSLSYLSIPLSFILFSLACPRALNAREPLCSASRELGIRHSKLLLEIELIARQSLVHSFTSSSRTQCWWVAGYATSLATSSSEPRNILKFTADLLPSPSVPQWPGLNPTKKKKITSVT